MNDMKQAIGKAERKFIDIVKSMGLLREFKMLIGAVQHDKDAVKKFLKKINAGMANSDGVVESVRQIVAENDRILLKVMEAQDAIVLRRLIGEILEGVDRLTDASPATLDNKAK